MRVIFRFKPNDKKAWVGFTEGNTWEDIFWAIDEFGDPFEANVIKLPHKYPISFCVPFANDGDEGWGTLEEGREVGEMLYMAMPDIDSPEWETKQAKEWREYIVDGPYSREESDEFYD